MQCCYASCDIDKCTPLKMGCSKTPLGHYALLVTFDLLITRRAWRPRGVLEHTILTVYVHNNCHARHVFTDSDGSICWWSWQWPHRDKKLRNIALYTKLPNECRCASHDLASCISFTLLGGFRVRSLLLMSEAQPRVANPACLAWLAMF